jgi:energy-coupling factor transporter transmembrane protein EcfT
VFTRGTTAHRGWPLGTLGYLACLVFALVLAVLAQGWRVGLAWGVTLVLAAAFYPVGLDAMRRVWMWILIAFLLIPSIFLGDAGDWTTAGTGFGPSWAGLASGTAMSLRTIAIVVTVSGFAASVSVSELAGLLERAGAKGLGFALGVAVNMLPIVQETATTTFHALRLRGGFRHRRLQAVRLLLVTIIVNSLHHADDIVSAAEARAFSATSTRPMPWKRRRSDGVLALALLAIGAVIVWG